MNTRKRIQALKQKLQNRRQQLATARKQPDDVNELHRLTREVAELEAQLQRLQNG